MKELNKEKYDVNNGMWYIKEGDYYYPEYYVGKGLTIEEATKIKEQKEKEYSKDNNEEIEYKQNLGKYALARLNYIKEYKKVLYLEMKLNNTLYEHLLEVDKRAHKQVDEIVLAMAKQDGTNEELKAKDQLKWVRFDEQL